MLHVIEPLRHGVEHQAFNASLLLACRQAFPNDKLCFWAHPSHIEAVREVLSDSGSITFYAIEIPPRHAAGVHRLRLDTRNSLLATRESTLPQKSKVILSSVTSQMLWALRAVSLTRSVPPTLAILHGGLTVGLRRPKYNVIGRVLSLRTALSLAPEPLRFAVLEQNILAEIGRAALRLAPRCIVLPHPLPPDLMQQTFHRTHPTSPVRIAFLGLATPQKGLLVFLELAKKFAIEYPGQVEFHMLGKLHPAVAQEAQPYIRYLTRKPALDPLPRKAFVDGITAMDYAAFFFEGAHYDMTASGVLLDCVALGLPVIGRHHPLFEELSASVGEIGEFCLPGEEAALVSRIVSNTDPARYMRHHENIRRLREARMPYAIGYRLRAVFGEDPSQA